jgi:hypothetical protein
MMKAMFGLLILVFVFSGCKRECFIRPGDYAMTLAPKSGDCPENIISQFASYSDHVTIPPATACTRFLTTVEDDADSCKLTMDVSAKTDATGLHEGVGIFRVACEDKFSCRHEFDVTFKAVAAIP